MNTIKSIRIYFLIFFVVCKLPAGQNEKDMKGLIINGANFWFTIHEPENWKIEIEDANLRQLNAYFTLTGYSWENSPAVIYVRVMDKFNISAEKHLIEDMEDYKKKKTKIIFKNFKIDKLKYLNYTKQYIMNDETCDYLCYLDPGKEFKTYLIFVLTSDVKNCEKYFNVFSSFLKSFSWGGDQIKDIKK